MIIICSDLGNGAMSESGKYLFRAADLWSRCAQVMQNSAVRTATGCTQDTTSA